MWFAGLLTSPTRLQGHITIDSPVTASIYSTRRFPHLHPTRRSKSIKPLWSCSQVSSAAGSSGRDVTSNADPSQSLGSSRSQKTLQPPAPASQAERPAAQPQAPALHPPVSNAPAFSLNLQQQGSNVQRQGSLHQQPSSASRPSLVEGSSMRGQPAAGSSPSYASIPPPSGNQQSLSMPSKPAVQPSHGTLAIALNTVLYLDNLFDMLSTIGRQTLAPVIALRFWQKRQKPMF